jgi:single-stranded-DNA-specific exonuclease
MSYPAPCATSDAFLGVERSLTGRRWQARLDRAGEARAEAMAQAHGFDDVLARVLAGRGVTSETALAWLDPTLRDLMPDPSTLVDMDAAVDRLVAAIERGEQIAIFGDYDVDGACSSALLAQFLTAAGAPPPFIHIPDRILEGYGPNIEAIRDLAARGARLLVTVDCGTTSHEALSEAKALGMDPIVFDHHQAPEILPQALVVNPNRQDDLSGQGALCAAGVVFMALAALNRELRRRGHWTTARPAPDLLASLDLVALATVADVAALTGLNRALVTKGMAVMRGRGRIGLSALMDAARMDGPPRPYHLGFLLGPRINAGGRIGDAGLGARLLTLEDPVHAAVIARDLDRLNEERRAIEKATLELAEAEAERQLRASNNVSCLVVAGADWHPGVVGLVASRLKDKFNLPTFAIAFNEETGTGSGRGLTGVDLGRTVRAAVESGRIMKGGGHAMAAGVTLARDQLDDFRGFMNDSLQAALAERGLGETLSIDAALTARGAKLQLLRQVELAGPFGQGNAEPIFALSAHRIAHASVVGADHVRARLQAGDGAQVDAICFRAMASPLGEALLQGRGGAFHVATRLSVGVFRGGEKLDAQIVDMAPARS